MTKAQRRYFRFVDEGRELPEGLKVLRLKLSPALFARARLEAILEKDRAATRANEKPAETRQLIAMYAAMKNTIDGF